MSDEQRKQLTSLRRALDEESVADDVAREVVRELGVDVHALAARLRTTVAEWETNDRKRRIANAEKQRRRREARIAQLPSEPIRPRAEQLALLEKFKPKGATSASVHYMKFEKSSQEDLARLVALARFEAEHPELDVDDEGSDDDDI
jgi:hypothetical protein